MSELIAPYRLAIPEADLDDLRMRLARTRRDRLGGRGAGDRERALYVGGERLDVGCGFC